MGSSAIAGRNPNWRMAFPYVKLHMEKERFEIMGKVLVNKSIVLRDPSMFQLFTTVYLVEIT